MAVQEKSMVPTVLVGIGGTGYEILARIRRLIEETYGSLENFPIISFLVIDTDRDYKVNSPLASGSPFKDNEKHWASVSGRESSEYVTNMSNYPWLDKWFPRELERNITALETGAGQIRACGRFAFFCNYHHIQKKFEEACRRVKGHQDFMLDKYGIQIPGTALNVFVTGSLSGGTGSGMLIDLGYCARHWIRGEQSPLVTAVVPMPTAFRGIDVGDRVLANGYAALMELSYFSDYRTEYVEQFSSGLVDEVKSSKPPFDFTYLVGTKNGEGEFKLDAIREMIAQNIFLDLTSDFAPHKRSIRDNIKSAWASQDPGGRGYPKNFMSFGISTIEIPITLIRACLMNRLASDLVKWWLNELVELPPQLPELVQNQILKPIKLSEIEILTSLSLAGDRDYEGVIASWINSIRDEIAKDTLLNCSQQGFGLMGTETGKILGFVSYLQGKVAEYEADNFRDISPNKKDHGGFLLKMYDNCDQSVRQGRKALEEEFYKILEDRSRGPKFATQFIESARAYFSTVKNKYELASKNVWQPKITEYRNKYQEALDSITLYKDKGGWSKQAHMEEYKEDALKNIQEYFFVKIRVKVRSKDLGLTVLERMEDCLSNLESRLSILNQKLVQARDAFATEANQQAASADALLINGLKLFDRDELNNLYQDLIEKFAGSSEGRRTTYEIGMDQVCNTLSAKVLREASPLWKENRTADEVMRLFDVANLPEIRDEDFKRILVTNSRLTVIDAPDSSILKRDLAACDRFLKIYRNNEPEIRKRVREAYNKSKPMIILSSAMLKRKDAGFTPALNRKVAIVGGNSTADAAAQKFIPYALEYVGNADAITPLGRPERHRIVFVQETGGFSLRCISDMPDLRQSYLDWKGANIEAKRAQLRGEARDNPIPVHIQKESPFWDVFPENPEVFKLVIKARALGVLYLETNRAIRERVVRYKKNSPLGLQDIDIAASWEESVQVLEIRACQEDREEIQRQVNAQLNNSQTDDEKRSLLIKLRAYIQSRAVDLEKEGGTDSAVYRREATVILELIGAYHLNVDNSEISSLKAAADQAQAVEELPNNNNTESNNHVFCTNCGTKNPKSAKFCSNCGTQLVPPTI
jgi:hypothetical protein